VTARSHLLRRDALKFLAGAALAPVATAGMPTKFQLACMTLPYANFPLERALKAIASAGYKYVAWGTTHQNSPGRKDPVIAADAPASEGKRLAEHCRSMGLQPVMMFSEIYVAAPESIRVHTRRIE
jgi:sugar phosphate isomerase/epimerase